jgi:hypothetical protein
MGPTAAPQTSLANLRYTPCKNPKTKNEYSLRGESLKPRSSTLIEAADSPENFLNATWVQGVTCQKTAVIISDFSLDTTHKYAEQYVFNIPIQRRTFCLYLVKYNA